MSKIVTLGEIMLRLSTPLQNRFVQTNNFDVVYGGGEANVCVSLANFGHETYFVSKLPKHEIGQAAINELNKYLVKTDYVVRGGNRVGIYFLETGASMRPSKVIYDRSHSSISEATPDEFDFSNIFIGKDWFHFSGITPALGKNCQLITEKALIAAKKYGLTVSVDLNYRKKLWTKEEAQKVMRPLMKYVDVCIGNEEDAELVLGYKVKGLDVKNSKLEIDSYKEMFTDLKEEFGFKFIATTLRESFSATRNGWSALLYDGNHFYQSRHYTIDPIIDRVGGGDSFSAGLIHGLLSYDKQDALEFATAASALKHTIFGDFNQVSIDEVKTLCDGDQSGRVQR
jgi:2-dehydro-3-deoxygluconokinase